MTKYFCDRCHKELKPKDHSRLKRTLGNCSIEIMTALNNTWNSGSFCHDCVVEVVVKGKDIK